MSQIGNKTTIKLISYDGLNEIIQGRCSVLVLRNDLYGSFFLDYNRRRTINCWPMTNFASRLQLFCR